MKTPSLILTLLISLQAFSQKPLVSVPFELFGDHIIINVSVDDSEPLEFVFDSGDGITVLDEEVADQLHLVRKKVILNEGTVYGSLIKHNKIEVGGYLIEKNINVYSTDLDHLEISLGRELDGILGYDLLKHHSVHIDYDKKIFDIYDLGVHPKQGSPIKFKLVNSIPTIEGKVVLNNGEPHDGTFFIMTGAGTTLDFNSPYALEYDVVHKTGEHYSYLVKSISDFETPHYEGRVQSFSFGDQTLEDLPIGISLATKGAQAHKKVSGIIGSKILSRFNLIIDLPTKTMYVERNQRYSKPFVVNCSGLDVQLSPDKSKVLIHQVFENSQAEKAGIKKDAELVSLNGKPSSDYDMAEITEMLKQDGSSIDLVVRQDGEDKAVTLQLKSLL